MISGAYHDALILSRKVPGRDAVRAQRGRRQPPPRRAHRPRGHRPRRRRAGRGPGARWRDDAPRPARARGTAGVAAGGAGRGRRGGRRGRSRRSGPRSRATRPRRSTRPGLHLLPGGVDPHVHLNEPGRTEWEGIATGTAALAVGGVTCAIDMPLNASPPVRRRRGFDAKAAAIPGVRSSWTSRCGAGWCPATSTGSTSSRRAASSASRRSCPSAGSTTSRASTTSRSTRGWLRAAALGLPVAVHAESDAITAGLAARARAAGRTGVRDYLASRPVVAETEAIARAMHLAADTGCALHVVHVSSGAGVALVADGACARRRRDVRGLPPPSRARRGRHGAPRRRGEVRAAAAPARGVRRAVDRGRGRGRRAGLLRPLAVAAVAEARATTCSPSGAGSRARSRRWSCW